MTMSLEEQLRDLGRAVRVDEPTDRLTAAVMERVAAEPEPARSRLRRWWVALVGGLLGVGVVLSPVGAQVAEWLSIGAVDVRVGPGASTGDAEVPRARGDLTVAEAGEQVGFAPGVPVALGAPDAVEVADGMVGMTWGGGAEAVRLDQVDDPIAPYFWKSSRAVSFTRVGDVEALWFDDAHELVVLGEDGSEATTPPRLAARTLVWAVGSRTYRLEGDLTRSEAVAIAESVR